MPMLLVPPTGAAGSNVVFLWLLFSFLALDPLGFPFFLFFSLSLLLYYYY